jgi:hypothetical protein
MKINDFVNAKVLYCYPQGWIVSLGDWLGLFNSKKQLEPGQIVSGHIKSYDEGNLWVLIE